MAKKGKELMGDMTESVGKAAESVSKQGEQFTKSPVFKSVHSVSKEFWVCEKVLLVILWGA